MKPRRALYLYDHDRYVLVPPEIYGMVSSGDPYVLNGTILRLPKQKWSEKIKTDLKYVGEYKWVIHS